MPKTNTTRTEMTFPTRQVTTFGCTGSNGYTYPTPRHHTRTETYCELKYKNEHTDEFDIFCLTVSYCEKNTPYLDNDKKMCLYFYDKEKAEKAKKKLSTMSHLKLGVWMGGYYIKEIDYYSYADNYFATSMAISVTCLAAMGLTGLCFYFFCKQDY